MARQYKINPAVMDLRAELVSLNWTRNRTPEQDARMEEIRAELRLYRIMKAAGL